MNNMYQIDAVLADLDGTLFDTEMLHRKVWEQLANQFELTLDHNHYKKHFIGHALEYCFLKFEIMLQDAGKNVSAIDLFSLFRDIEIATYAQGIAFKPGAEALLNYVKNENKPLGLVTSATPEKIKLVFGNTDYLSFFDLVISAQDVTHKKPHPEPYLKACQALNISPCNALVIEDSNTGATSACTAGCCCAVIPEPTTVLDDALQTRAAFIIPSLYDLTALLQAKETIGWRHA